MSSTYGRTFQISIFGESHGKGIGVVIDGVPAGIPIEGEKVLADMKRRMPRAVAGSTARRESDVPRVLSGIYQGSTTGSPICAVIENNNQRSRDYDFDTRPRPSHADYTAAVKYGGFADMRGGGHFSGRLTAPLVFAGAVARQYLETRGVTVGSHILSIGGIEDDTFDPVNIDIDKLKCLYNMQFPVLNEAQGKRMEEEIERARMDCDSVGGVIECAAVGLPVGIGEPMFDGIEPALAKGIFGIPAVKSLEFGAGRDITALRGSQANDQMTMRDGQVAFLSNNSGGVLGGISNGMPLVLRVGFKPTASIAKEQRTVNLKEEQETRLVIQGRHDSCIAVRGLAAVEAVVAIGLADLMIGQVKQ